MLMENENRGLFYEFLSKSFKTLETEKAEKKINKFSVAVYGIQFDPNVCFERMLKPEKFDPNINIHLSSI